MANLVFVSRSYAVRGVWPPASRVTIVLDGSMEQIEDYALMHNLAWVVSASIEESDLKDRVVYSGYWTDSVGNMFVPV